MTIAARWSHAELAAVRYLLALPGSHVDIVACGCARALATGVTNPGFAELAAPLQLQARVHGCLTGLRYTAPANPAGARPLAGSRSRQLLQAPPQQHHESPCRPRGQRYRHRRSGPASQCVQHRIICALSPQAGKFTLRGRTPTPSLRPRKRVVPHWHRRRRRINGSLAAREPRPESPNAVGGRLPARSGRSITRWRLVGHRLTSSG